MQTPAKIHTQALECSFLLHLLQSLVEVRRRVLDRVSVVLHGTVLRITGEVLIVIDTHDLHPKATNTKI